MSNLKSAIMWYTKGGLFHPFYIVLAILPTILLIPYRDDPMFDNYFMFYVDLTIMPLAALMAALHIVREPQVTIFEISILKSPRTIYIAKLIVYLIALSIGFIPLILLIIFTNKELFLIPLIHRMLTYIIITSISLLLETPKNVLIYLLVFFFLLPYTPPILLNRARMLDNTVDPITSIICYFFAPIASTLYKDLLGVELSLIQIIVSIAGIILIALSYFVFSRKEFAI